MPYSLNQGGMGYKGFDCIRETFNPNRPVVTPVPTKTCSRHSSQLARVVRDVQNWHLLWPPLPALLLCCKSTGLRGLRHSVLLNVRWRSVTTSPVMHIDWLVSLVVTTAAVSRVPGFIVTLTMGISYQAIADTLTVAHGSDKGTYPFHWCIQG